MSVSSTAKRLAATLLAVTLLATGTGFAHLPTPIQTATVLTPASPGSTTYSASGAEVDVSNISSGYITARYTGGSTARLKLRMTKSGGTTYTYDLSTAGGWETFAFTAGSGDYTIQVFQNVSGSSYAQLLSQTVMVSLTNETLPFLYPSQYVNFNASSQTVKKGDEVVKGAANELDMVTKVYNYVISTLTYDNNKASSVTAGTMSGYLPNVDSVLASGKGICFDYAAVMAAMLRSQGIPAKLVVGYAGQTYHAWITTYITDVGWVDGVIYFDGTSWKLMDPTFASSANKSGSTYVGDGTNYSQVFVY